MNVISIGFGDEEKDPADMTLEEKIEAAPSGGQIALVCLDILDLLLEKNIAYGNSALDPVRVFSKASTTEQIQTRIDDKLSRIQRGSEYPGDDTIDDLIGYLVLYKIANGLA